MKLAYIRCKSGAPQYHPKNRDDYKYWANPIQSLVGIDNVQEALGLLPQEILVVYDDAGMPVGIERKP